MAKSGKLGLGSGGGAHKLLSGAGGSIGAGHSTAGGASLSKLVPQGTKKAAETKGDSPAHKGGPANRFGPSGGPSGNTAAKGTGGASGARRTAPGG